jgi:hypothetical protein
LLGHDGIDGGLDGGLGAVNSVEVELMTDVIETDVVATPWWTWR